MSNLLGVYSRETFKMWYNGVILNRKVDRRDAQTSGGLGKCAGGTLTMSNHTLDASSVKVCSRCGETKSIKDFYVRKKGLRAGQVRSSCKMCEAASHAEYRRANPTKDAEYKFANRERYTHLEAKRRASNRKAFNGYMADYRERRPELQAAHNAVNNAVRAGRFPPISSRVCASCGAQAEHYHHHNGYDEEHRLDVIPLCVSCHEEAHHNG